MQQQYSDEQIAHVREQAAIYQCACPAQVCASIAAMRELYAYQARCMDATDVDRAVHLRIAAAADVAHAELERCLTDILNLEGWDMTTLTMPANLQKRLLESLQKAME